MTQFMFGISYLPGIAVIIHLAVLKIFIESDELVSMRNSEKPLC
jgi:hypothetical protein